MGIIHSRRLVVFGAYAAGRRRFRLSTRPYYALATIYTYSLPRAELSCCHDDKRNKEKILLTTQTIHTCNNCPINQILNLVEMILNDESNAPQMLLFLGEFPAVNNSVLSPPLPLYLPDKVYTSD